jgi:hypothetical protein
MICDGSLGFTYSDGRWSGEVPTVICAGRPVYLARTVAQVAASAFEPSIELDDPLPFDAEDDPQALVTRPTVSKVQAATSSFLALAGIFPPSKDSVR